MSERNDDKKAEPRLVNRRAFLYGGLVTALAAGPGIRSVLASAWSVPSGGQAAQVAGGSCIASPQLTEGPYFVDEGLNRSDIRTDPVTGEISAGLPLRLAMSVLLAQEGGCVPLAGAQVDVWHCDASGVYSDVADPLMGGAGLGRKFLRGYQLTDASGRVEFLTIYPGWYQGRAVHIHFKIRTDPGAAQGYEFTSQFFFDDALNNQIFTTVEPYTAKGGAPMPNNADGIYRQSGGLLTLQPAAEGDGYAASFVITLAFARTS